MHCALPSAGCSGLIAFGASGVLLCNATWLQGEVGFEIGEIC